MIFAAPLDRLRSRLGNLVGRYRYAVAALDQVALSVFGFALNLVLVRALTATDYGIVALWMALALLALSVQSALVNSSLSVHVHAAPDPAAARRLGEALAVVNLLAIGLTTLIIVLVDAVADAEWAPRDTVATLAIPLFVAAGMYREYTRSLAFSRNDMVMLLWIDAPYLVVTSLCLGAMLMWPERFAGLAGAFLAMSLGCIVSQLLLSGRFRRPRPRPFQRGWLAEYRQVALDVGWALIGVIATHLHARSYLYVTVNLVGLAALAAINIVGVLFRPLRMMMTAWGRTALPELTAHLAAGRVEAFNRAVVRACCMAAAGGGVWMAALWLGWGVIERHILAGNYPDARLLLWPWAVAATLDAMGSAIDKALQAAREFKFLAYATMFSAPVTIAATVGAVLWHGYTWTMYGVAVGNLLSLAATLRHLRRVRRRFAVPSTLPQAADNRPGGAAAKPVAGIG